MQHSVTLDKSRCMGCTTCMKHCPTEAIRVRRGTAHILKELCIDCGMCIRVCPHKAKKAVCDPFDSIKNFEYSVALPAPSLYGQFHNLDDVNIVLQALLDIGFDDIYEVSKAAEMVSDLTRKLIKELGSDMPRPYISSACPVAVRLITTRFPKLIPHVTNIIAPVELAAIHARKEVVKKTGLAPEKIGIFFITPCPAKVTSGKYSLTLNEPVIDGSISMTDIYKRLLVAMPKVKNPPQLASSGLIGIGWSTSGGESSALLNDRHLAVDGIDNIIKILEDLEDGMLPEIEFLELNACTQGCVGGCLTVENPFVAKSRVKHLMKYMPVSKNKVDENDIINAYAFAEKPLEYIPVWQLDEDRSAAMEKYAKIEEIKNSMPGLDCGSCGAPSCMALAENIVMGYASEEDCIFRMRERMQYMAGSDNADEYLPPPFRKETGKNKKSL